MEIVDCIEFLKTKNSFHSNNFDFTVGLADAITKGNPNGRLVCSVKRLSISEHVQVDSTFAIELMASFFLNKYLSDFSTSLSSI